MSQMTTLARARHIAGEAYGGLFRHPFWNVGIVYAPIVRFLSSPKPEVSWFPSTQRGRFLADPFAIVKNGTTYVFCEEFDYSKYKGRIVCLEIHDGHISKPKVAIELPCHMSYPYLIQHGGDVYCTPETSAQGEINLYKASEFPLKWKKTATIVSDFSGVDPTIFQHEGYWWLTCGTEDCTKLYIWYASELQGEWRPHSANPTKIDAIMSSRPAGTPFVHEGFLYRPAQDCSKMPGGRITLNRVLKLTTSEFKEQEVGFIEPYTGGPYPRGIHTISAVTGHMTLLDGNAFRFSLGGFRRYLGIVKDKLGN